MAAEAARSATQQIGRFSPLLIYGPVGDGQDAPDERRGVHGAPPRGNGCESMQLTAEQFTSQFLGCA